MSAVTAVQNETLKNQPLCQSCSASPIYIASQSRYEYGMRQSLHIKRLDNVELPAYELKHQALLE